eukprot:397757-Rhodomonas_salina.2
MCVLDADFRSAVSQSLPKPVLNTWANPFEFSLWILLGALVDTCVCSVFTFEPPFLSLLSPAFLLSDSLPSCNSTLDLTADGAFDSR